MDNITEELRTSIIQLYAQAMRLNGCSIPEDELRDSIRHLWDSGELELVDGLDGEGNYAVQLQLREANRPTNGE